MQSVDSYQLILNLTFSEMQLLVHVPKDFCIPQAPPNRLKFSQLVQQCMGNFLHKDLAHKQKCTLYTDHITMNNYLWCGQLIFCLCFVGYNGKTKYCYRHSILDGSWSNTGQKLDSTIFCLLFLFLSFLLFTLLFSSHLFISIPFSSLFFFFFFFSFFLILWFQVLSWP